MAPLIALDFHDDFGDEFGDERDSDVAAASSTSHNITDWEVWLGVWWVTMMMCFFCSYQLNLLCLVKS